MVSACNLYRCCSWFDFRVASAEDAQEYSHAFRCMLQVSRKTSHGVIPPSAKVQKYRRQDHVIHLCFRTEHMNAFLSATLLYFDAFHEHSVAEADENITVPG